MKILTHLRSTLALGRQTTPVPGPSFANDFRLMVESLRDLRSEAWYPHLENLRNDGTYAFLDACLGDLNLVYCAGKVGSKSLAATLARRPELGQVHHFHFLSDFGIEFLRGLIREGLPGTDNWQMQLAHAYYHRTVLSARRDFKTPRPTVITGVREPVAMFLSFAFETWWMHADKPEGLTVGKLQKLFRTRPWHRWMDDWMRYELGAMFELDVYASDFPHARGWKIYETDRARILMQRQESFDRASEALGALYNRNPADLPIATTNTADEKSYKTHYKTILRDFHLPAVDLEAAYALPYAQHFYTAAERARFRSQWESRKMTAAA